MERSPPRPQRCHDAFDISGSSDSHQSNPVCNRLLPCDILTARSCPLTVVVVCVCRSQLSLQPAIYQCALHVRYKAGFNQYSISNPPSPRLAFGPRRTNALARSLVGGTHGKINGMSTACWSDIHVICCVPSPRSYPVCLSRKLAALIWSSSKVDALVTL